MVPVFSSPENSRRLFAELDRRLGTPWAHMASEDGFQTSIPGVGGDCTTLLTDSFTDAGFIERLYFPAHAVAPGLEPEEVVGQASSLPSAGSLSTYLQRFVDAGRVLRLDARRPLPSNGGAGVGSLLPGDLLTFRWGARDHHLGVYRGGPARMFYHAPGPGHSFMLEPLAPYFVHLRSAYRLISTAPDCSREPARGPSSAISNLQSQIPLPGGDKGVGSSEEVRP